MYPEKHEYETVVPQLYGPDDGFVLALVTIGGLPHRQTSVSESATFSSTNMAKRFKFMSTESINL